MKQKVAFWKILLLGPLTFLYGTIVKLRNFCYDNKIFSSKAYDIPIISIGNISVGGTGKTPHTEYILNMLKNEFSVAVLSRGYKRKTRGFRLVETSCTALEVGDEPLQIKRKYPEIIVAVDASRQRGIETLLDQFPDLNVIILDDAFQHRKVRPGLSILLNNFSYPLSEDYILPLGRLRESKSSCYRAHIIIVSKCPEDLKPIERRIMQKEMEVLPFQHLFFSTIERNELRPCFPEFQNQKILKEDLKQYNVIGFTGIAKIENFINYFEPKCKTFTHIEYSDHKNYSKEDINKIINSFNTISEPKIMITTEKDMVRFLNNELFPEEYKEYLYYSPINVKLLANDDEQKQFDNQIFSYVRNNKRYSKLYKNAYSG